MRAFTLIELIIVLAIVTGLATIGLPLASRAQTNSQLQAAAASLAEDLRLAQADSQAGWQDASYGIKFLSDHYVVYQGSDYVSRQVAKDRVVQLGAFLNINPSLSPLAAEVVFDRRGAAKSAGAITISHDNGASLALSINKLGVIIQP